ncbi:MAG: efflux RND transporter periplasmic adaptor subunit [Proteobacteria bacterium]|nr:efflux RND transporter periplasmic adaptor subunit [Pseudomonadota bacterium]MDA1302248.1 efflux RND transporter periplasmic adaptor subunit [Pseudomonadota bacterium]
MIRKFILPLLVMMGFTVAAAGLMMTSVDVQPTVPEPIPRVVKVIEVNPQTIRLTVDSQGTIAPRTQSELVPEVSGRVVEVSPALAAGGHFRKGDILLRIDDADYRTALSRAQATVQRSQAELELARFEHDRQMQLEGQQLASRSQFQQAERTLKVAMAAVSEATTALKQAERDLRRTELRAPFDGRVRNERADVGQFIQRGTSIGTLYASDTVEVRLPVADRQLAFLNIPFGYQGDIDSPDAPRVTLSAEFAGKKLKWEGTIVRTEAEIDAQTRMVNVVAQIRTNNDPQLSVGLFVAAKIQGREVDDVIVLPRAALRGNDRVLVVDSDDRMYHRDITPLRLYEDKVIVQSGLLAGERVCVSPIQTVIDGMRVSPAA